jgi:hypothetical protein
MTIRSRCLVLAAFAGICSSSAFADVFGFESAGYVPGSGINGVLDPNGSTWQKEGTETFDFIVDNVVVSPLANPLVGSTSTKSLRYDFDGGNAARLGVDLATPMTSGIVTLQYDYRNSTRVTGNNLMRINILNRAGVTSASPAGTDDIEWQPYMQNGGGGAAAQNGFFGLQGFGANITGFGVFGDCRGQAPAFPDIYCNNVYSPQLLTEATGANDHWYRVKMWFDLSDAVNPGRLVYAAIYDINCGTEIQIAENHRTYQATPIQKNNSVTSANAVRAFQLRAAGSGTADSVLDQQMWLDNLVLAPDPGFVLPAPAGGGPPVAATTLNGDAGTQAVSTAFLLPTNVGDTPSLARVGSTVYTLDGNNGLTTWTGGASSTFTDDALEVAFDTDATGVMVPDTAGNLYVVANQVGSAGAGWRDLLRFDVGTGTWITVCDGDATGGNTGNHSASLLTFGGTNHVLHAWTGAAQYPSLNTNGTRGPLLANVGNRWAGATTEAFAHGSSGSQMYYLQQTTAAGSPISNNLQAFNAIYRADFGLGCDAGSALVNRLSPTARTLPWQTNAADGGNVNRHQMEFDPAHNRIWVLRAGGSNEVGIYDIAQDRYGTLKLTNGANPLVMDHADLLLSADGSQMYIMSRGEGAVYAASTTVSITNVGGCITGSTCTLLTASACATAGGTYVGDNQVCPAPGACCNASACTIQFQVTCTAGGGTFQGGNTVCSSYTSSTGGAFEDIDATGTAITTLGDDDSVTIPIGFSYSFYGNAYTDVRVGANGYLSFSGGDGPESWTPHLGSSVEPNNLIAGLWTDLSPQIAPGSVKYQVLGATPARRLIVQWTRVSQYTASTPIDENTFQIVLFEGTNNSEVRFGVLNNPSTTPLPPYQSGLENIDGSQSVVVPTASIVNNGLLQFAPTPNPCACHADFNHSGGLEVQDIFDFLAAWFAGSPSANFNGVNGLEVQDIFDFLAAWFAGC